MTEYNRRQLSQISGSIDAYRGGSLGFPRLINNLKALIACLESPEQALRDVLRVKWGVLEEVYAVSLDQGEGISTESLSLINKTLDEMKDVITKAV